MTAVSRIGAPVLLLAAFLAALSALAAPMEAGETAGLVLVVNAIGVLANLGVISWLRWSVERLAHDSAVREVERHNDRADVHRASELATTIRRLEAEVQGLREVQVGCRAEIVEARRAAQEGRRYAEADGFDVRPERKPPK